MTQDGIGVAAAVRLGLFPRWTPAPQDNFSPGNPILPPIRRAAACVRNGLINGPQILKEDAHFMTPLPP